MVATRHRSGNLTAALVAVGLADLAVGRIGARVFFSSDAGSLGVRLIELAPFVANLAAVLGMIVFFAAVSGLLYRREFFLPGIRVSVAAVSLFFLAFCAVAILSGRLPERLLIYLHTSSAFISLLLVASILGSSVPWRNRIGVTLFALPGALQAVALFLDRSGRLPEGALFIGGLNDAGQFAGLAAFGLSFALLPQRKLPAGKLSFAIAAATLTAIAFSIALAAQHDVTQAILENALGVDLPSPPGAVTMLYVTAGFGLVLGVLHLLLDPGSSRLAGYGVMLLAIAGYRLGAAHEFLLAQTGLLALAVGVLRFSEPTVVAPKVSEEAWRAFVARLAPLLDDGSGPDGRAPEAVLVHDDDVEITRLRLVRRGHNVSLRLRRRHGRVVEFEVQVGEMSRADPSAVIETRGVSFPKNFGARPHDRSTTGDPDFDRRFLLAGELPQLDEPLRLRVLQHVSGTLALYPNRSLRYRALPGKNTPADHPFGTPADPVPALALLEVCLAVLDAAADGGAPAAI